MQRLAEACEAIAATTKKLVKIGLVAEYLRSRPSEEAATSAVFLSGRPFPVHEETTLQVGGSLLWRTVRELSGKTETELTDSYRRYGDLGAVAGEVLPPRASERDLSVIDAERSFREIAAARGSATKAALVRSLLERATSLQAKYLVKIMTGDLRIGLKESLVEEAIAKAYERPIGSVRRANMLLGDIGETLQCAFRNELETVRFRLFHPIDFMLATPVETAAEIFKNAAEPMVVEE